MMMIIIIIISSSSSSRSIINICLLILFIYLVNQENGDPKITESSLQNLQT